MQTSLTHSKWYLPVLKVLTALFAFRVLAQITQYYLDLPFLPEFGAWQSGALPYGWLVFFQILILAIMLSTLRKLSVAEITPRRKRGIWLLAVGALYLIGMLARLYVGIFFVSSPAWFHAPIPTIFHLVLALFVLLIGYFHYSEGISMSPHQSSLRSFFVWTVYPGVMVISLAQYYALPHWGVSLALSSYFAAMLGGFGLITLLELVLPYRSEWVPNREEIKTDLFYIVTVQVLLPHLLSILTVLWLVDRVRGWNLATFWPQSYPAWTQMLLMMFTADFFRYWLHRAAHTWVPLWQFHAVHHSVQKLYWINVGRFHPVDKALQFLCDALPFILLGVSQEVIALYFVVYSIKGFFQHSNVDVRLGWFNYIISGPELHRWHHSKRIKESNSNYGNNIIVWDVLFGTYFLPKDKEVAELGLLNRNYPMAFLAQMKAPFIKGLDKK